MLVQDYLNSTYIAILNHRVYVLLDKLMAGVDLTIGNSTFKDVPESLANGINVEFQALIAEKKRLDSENETLKQDKKDMGKKSYKVNGKEYMDMEEMYKDYSSMYEDMCGMKKELDMYQKEMEKTKAKKDALETELSKADSNRNDAAIEQRKRDRQLERVARDHMPNFSEERFDSLSSLEVKQEIVKAAGHDVSDRNETSLDAMIEVITRSDAKRKQNYQKQQENFVNATGTSQRFDVFDVINHQIAERNKKIENAWKEGFNK